ncbi:MAG: DUF2505 domain-containing protein [Polyangia bacterium]|jgi:hypothetical protein
MGKFTVTHEINCNAETFWEVFFDKAFNEQLFLRELGFPEFTVISQTDSATSLVRKVSGQPKMDLPGPVAKLLGPGFRFTEDGTFDKTTKLWKFKMTPSTMADKLRQEGSMRIEPIGDSKVRRIAELSIEAKIFGLGGLIESTTEKQLREGWDKSAVFFNRYLQSKKG